MILDGKNVLITGGTGSFGKQFVKTALASKLNRLAVFSRDELKQFEMSNDIKDPRLEFFVGDVRDKDRLYRALDGIDYVIHAAALKQIPSCEYNPFEAIKTNVIGAENIMEVAIDRGVRKVIALSSDKAVNPINLYGATKLCSDKIFVAGNSYTGKKTTKFSVVRYGNVVGSRGSVIPFFLQWKSLGILPITDVRMTRFWITLEKGVDFVIQGLEMMRGGEIFVPKIPSMKIVDLAQAIGPECKLDIVGIRPGEKLHEVMITEDDARYTYEYSKYFIIEPAFHWWRGNNNDGGNKVPEGFRYSSDLNTEWLSVEDLRRLVCPN